jgi:branched-chain amino acid aminotransferase
MSVPLDDHVVHRGDGVFEMSKCVGGRIYQLNRHLERLARSAQAIQLGLPTDLGTLKRLAVAVVNAGGRQDSALRIYITRGPGGFTTNPRECPEAGVYVIASELHAPSPQAYAQGVCIGVSSVPGKSVFYASVKSCNYLPNVLLKTEAVRRGWDYAIGLDEVGNLTEGSTENVGLVDSEGRLLLPPPTYILEGITVSRAKEIAREMVAEGLLKSVENRTLIVNDLRAASEVMLFGTTLDVLPVTRLGGDHLGGGQVGPLAKELLRRFRHDVAHNPAVSTPAF